MYKGYSNYPSQKPQQQQQQYYAAPRPQAVHRQSSQHIVHPHQRQTHQQQQQQQYYQHQPEYYSEDDSFASSSHFGDPLSNVSRGGGGGGGGGNGGGKIYDDYEEQRRMRGIVDNFKPAGQSSPEKWQQQGSAKRKEFTKDVKDVKDVKDTTKSVKLSPPRANKKNKKEQDDVERQKNWKAADGWVKQGMSRQDQISHNREEFVKRFEGYVEIKPEEYSDIQPNTPIRYMKHNPNAPFQYDYRSGGVLVRNGYPDYWVLKPYDGRGKNWSVPLKGQNKYFRKDDNEIKRAQARNAKLYEKVEAGEIMIMDKDAFADMKKENEELKQRLKALERKVRN